MRRPPGLAVALALCRDREAVLRRDVQRQVWVVKCPSGGSQPSQYLEARWAGLFRPAWEWGGDWIGRTQTSGRQPCSGSQTPRRPSPMAVGCRATSATRHLWPCRCAGSGVAGGGAWIRCKAKHGGRCCGGYTPHRGLVLVWTGQPLLNLRLHLRCGLEMRPRVASGHTQ